MASRVNKKPLAEQKVFHERFMLVYCQLYALIEEPWMSNDHEMLVIGWVKSFRFISLVYYVQ